MATPLPHHNRSRRNGQASARGDEPSNGRRIRRSDVVPAAQPPELESVPASRFLGIASMFRLWERIDRLIQFAMTPAQIELLKEDFLEWTGGFEPESEEDVETYVMSSITVELDPAEARQVLTDWMRDARSANIP